MNPTFVKYVPLGSGGMADVHLARMERDGRVEMVALKRLRPGLADSAEHVALFEREAHICSLLSHPNVVGLRAYGVDDEGPFMALEFVHGRSAAALNRAFVAQGRPLELDAALSVACDVASGLDYAHRSGPVIHRDISLDNVLIAYAGVAKLGDFGIAKLLGATRHTQTGTVRGKMGYLAPELLDGHEADVKSDVFAFAAAVFRLVCGVAPWRGATELELMRAVLSAQVPRPGSLRPELPAAVDRWLSRALSRDRAERPEGVGGLLAVLEGSASPQRRAAVARALLEVLPLGADDKDSRITEALKVGTVSAKQPRSRRPRASLVALGLSGLTAATAATAVLLLRAKGTPVEVAAPAPAGSPAPAGLAAESAPAPEPMAEPTVEPTAAAKKPERRPRPRAQAAASAPGSVRVKVKPYGQVFVDGELKGETPLAPFELAAGRHSVIVVNEELGARKAYQVEVKPGVESELKVVLDGPPRP